MDVEIARDRIYEAAMLPDRWRDVLDMVAQIAGATGALLINDDQTDPVSMNSASLDGLLQEFMAGEWSLADTRMAKLLTAGRNGFLLEEDVYTQDEYSKDPLIQGFLKPRGFGWATATFVRHPSGSNLVISVERRFADGPVPRAAIGVLDMLRNDLTRAARLSAAIGLDRGRAMIEILAALDMPAGVISRNHRLLAINEKLKPLMPDVVRDARDRVSFAEPRADARLGELLLAGRSALPSAIPLRGTASWPPHIATFLPITGTVRDVFGSGLSLMILKPVAMSGGPDRAILKTLFNLTDAESFVLCGLAEGGSLSDIAKRHRVSIETVRSQLKSIFDKTEVRRQVDLVRLVASLAPRI